MNRHISKNKRGQGENPRTLSILYLISLSLLFSLGCGQTGSNGTTPVSISFKIPSAINKVSNAPAPSGITSITIEVSAPDMDPMTKGLSVKEGDLVTIDLDIPSGSGRKFVAKASDAQGNLLFRGETTSNLVAGVPVTVKIDMVATTATLTITKSGTGSGTVTSTPAGINCGATCSASFNSGTVVTLTATPAAGSVFAGWSGGGCTGTGTCTVTMSAATSVTATFNLQTFTLTATRAGTGTGTVTSSPAGINCGATCSSSFNSGTTVTLTAIPDAGSTFAGWSGGGCTGTGTCTVTMSAATSVTATFNLQTFKLTILGGGQTGTGPLPGTRVIRHDTTTGAVVGDLLTDANGVADFGNIGATRTTISIVTSKTFPCGNTTCTDKDISTFVNIPAGTLTDNERFSVTKPALSTFQVNLTSLPVGTTRAELITGNSGQENFGGNAISGSTASFTNVFIDRLQPDLKFSLLAQTRNINNAITGCGFLADQDPATANNTTLSFSASSAPVSIPFTTSEPIIALDSDILRKGVTFDQGGLPNDLQAPVTSGTFNLCGVPLAGGFDILVTTPQTTTASSKTIEMISSTMPVSLNFILPSLSIDSLSRSPDGKTISFTRSGADLGKLDLAFVEHHWKVGNTNYEWFLVGDPSLTSFTLPALPADLSDRIPPATGVGIEAFIGGLDNINGFDDILQKLSAAGGEFDDNLIFTATEAVWASRSNPIISVTKSGTGTGTVTSSPPGINCGASCISGFTGGTTVTLTATPDIGSTFGGWSGGCFGQRVSGNTCTLILNEGDEADIKVTATFNQQPILTITRSGTGSGTVTSSPAGINCGTICSASFNSGTAVTLTAVPAAGSTFAGWSGGGCTGTGTCTVTMSAATSVTATFNIQTFILTATRAGIGSGTVTSSPAGINCGATCSASFNSGTAVTLTAVPAAGSTFAGWSGGGCTGTGICTVTISAATTVTATFNTTAATAGTWATTGNMVTVRLNHTATLLPNGKVLVAGGIDFNASASAELYDPATGTWTATGSMTTARQLHTATLLPNGKVLVAGGKGVGGVFLASAELYDPATGLWTATGSMTTARQLHTATLLPNGKVLVAGGCSDFDCSTPPLASAELYDPATGTWAATGSMATARAEHTATLLPNGKVLVAGGFFSVFVAFTSAELYDPATGTWTATGSMATGRNSHTATLLPNGKVLVAGGFIDIFVFASASAELYDPATGTWTATGSMTTARQLHTATLLPNGKVLVAGGQGAGGVFLASAELYDPATGLWSATGSMATGRNSHTATLLPNGKVLVAGDTASAELYTPEMLGTPGTWVATGSLANARLIHHMATLLPNGKVLVAGGWNGSVPLASAEIYDPATGAWTSTGSLATARSLHTATLLPNGKVLVAGGWNGSVSLASAEIYDPATGAWTSTGSLAAARDTHTATLLPNGKVLVAGGCANSSCTSFLASAELYDPASATWTTTGSMGNTRVGHTATLLPNGKVLVAGGCTGTDSSCNFGLALAELYDPATGTWTATTGSMTTAREFHTATLLPNNKVLVAGGQGSGSIVLASAELYDPATGLWSATGSMVGARNVHTATLLPNGKVMVAGGCSGFDCSTPPLASAELYDPVTGTWAATGSMAGARRDHSATLLPTNGKVLVAGGCTDQGCNSVLASAELYSTSIANPALGKASFIGIDGGSGGEQVASNQDDSHSGFGCGGIDLHGGGSSGPPDMGGPATLLAMLVLPFVMKLLRKRRIDIIGCR